MHQHERIAWYVMRGEIIESECLYKAFREFGGNKNLKGRAAKAEWLQHISPKVLYNYYDFVFVRVCSHCGKPMGWGYCINGGSEYYCSDKCLHQHYTEEEFEQMYDEGNGDSYYTAWID